MIILDYLVFVGKKLDEAEKSNNTKEWIRLANVLTEALQEQIKKLQLRELVPWRKEWK